MLANQQIHAVNGERTVEHWRPLVKDEQVYVLKKLIKEMATEKNKMEEEKKDTRICGKLVKVNSPYYLSTFNHGKLMIDQNVRRGGRRGILVKLVIRVSSGHQKIKITNFVKYATFAWFLLCNNILWLKNWFGNLIAHLTNILWLVKENSLSRGDADKIYSAFGQEKVFILHR